VHRFPDLRDDDGSAVVEFTLVTVLLTLLTVSILQLGLALHVRNTVTDAAAEGARYAALADNGLADGVERTRQLITTAIGSGYAENVSASYGDYLGHSSTEIRVVTTLPMIGLLGVDRGLEVSAHAAVETLDDSE
jgi:Flp pilus assembly pilin Flp